MSTLHYQKVRNTRLHFTLKLVRVFVDTNFTCLPKNIGFHVQPGVYKYIDLRTSEPNYVKAY